MNPLDFYPWLFTDRWLEAIGVARLFAMTTGCRYRVEWRGGAWRVEPTFAAAR